MASPPRNGDNQGLLPLTVNQVRKCCGSGIENAKLVRMVLNKQEKINELGVTDHVTFILEDETEKIDCSCDAKEMAMDIENGMYVEIHVNLKDYQGTTNQLEVFSISRVTTDKEVFSISRVTADKQVANHYVNCGHYEVSRMPGYHEIKEKILECFSKHMTRYVGVHLDEVIEHCNAANEDDVMVATAEIFSRITT